MNDARSRAAATGAVAGAAVALTPGSLPHAATTVAPAALLFALAGAAVASLVHRIRPSLVPGLRPVVAIAVAALAAATGWQAHARAVTGAGALEPWWPLAAAAAPALVIGVFLRVPGRVWAALLVCGAAVGGLVAVVSPAGATIPDVPPAGNVLYSYLDSDTDAVRAGRLADRWVAAGGLNDRAVVIAVPTGSGWLDGSAVDGFTRRFGGSVHSPDVTVLNNPTDPVADLTPSLLWRPPHHPVLAGDARGKPPWTPVLSAIGTLLDLPGSQSAPHGYGHRYGIEQAGPRTASGQSSGPRAAS
ncbi:MAG: alpha/beta-hydrolase family protein [Gordonia sp. (in: high G+C Gram-positive bacteria)]|uniref:alpha/beta-hydrolase family protein n=1 Tax=Gordonia sp. (in: high G+C Gram-positive bacteria) TaxID=84139 RepID=UPI0039E2F45D